MTNKTPQDNTSERLTRTEGVAVLVQELADLVGHVPSVVSDHEVQVMRREPEVGVPPQLPPQLLTKGRVRALREV